MSVAGPEPEATVADPGPEASWRRLSARMLLVYPVRELAGAIPALLGLVVAGRSVGKGEWWWGPLGVVGLIALSGLRWATTRYRITPEQVQLRTGLLRRKTVAAPADRVRSVDVTASALHRLLGLAKVEIGTGSHERESGLSLDSLPVAQATALRAELLHHSAVPSDGAATGKVVGTAMTADARNGDQDTELVRLDPGWVRFAPFTLSGVLGAGVILGIGSRLLDQLGVDADEVGPIKGVLGYLERTAVWLDVLQASLALLVFVTILSIGGYVLSYWGFRLSRHPGGSLQTTRGLLTTRATSIEERRLRGVELAEPLLLRAVHAARLRGIATGLRSGAGSGGGSALLLPPAPLAVAHDVAAKILQDCAPMEMALTAHGPAARRRRLVRALLSAAVVVGAAAGLAKSSGASAWLVMPSLATIPFAVILAEDRYRSLGHAMTGNCLVMRAGCFARRRDVLECEGIIGWNLRQSFFQRRAGLASLTATTAAGRQRYVVTDLPLSAAVSLGNRALPMLLTDFLDPRAEPPLSPR